MIALLLSLVSAGAAQASKPVEPVRFGGFLMQIDGLEEPSSVAVGPNDEIYVVERFAHRVRVFDATGKEQRSLGVLGSKAGELLEPHGIAVASDGSVFVADTGKDWIARFTAEGESRGVLRVGRTEQYELRTPLGIDTDGVRVVAANSRRAAIGVFTLHGPDLHASDASLRSIGREASLGRPADVAIGDDGEIFVADVQQHRVVHVDADGRALGSWGDFGPYPGQLASPSGIDHAEGRVYVADRENHRIQVFDTRGKLLYDWGVHALRPHEGHGRVHYPNDVAIAPSGRFAVVCEGFENRVQIFGPETEESVSLARSQERNTAAHFGFGISTGGDVLAVVEPDAPNVLVYDLTQEEPIEITRIGMFGPRVGSFLLPADVEIDPSGELAFVADPDARRVDVWSIAREPGEPLRYDPLLARLVQSYDMQAEHEQKLRKWSPFVVEPIAMEADATGHLWVVDAAGSGVIRIDLSLEHDRCTGIAAQTSRPIGLGWKGKNSLPLDYTHGRGVASLVLQIPTDVALDRAGDILYVVDAGEQRVEAYRVAEIGGDKEVEPAFTFGGFGRENGRFVRPTGICAGVDGFVYVTDEGGHRVLKFDEKGTFVAEWGKQGLGQVEFYKPRGITQGADGKLYVVDYGNHRGQVLTSDGGFVVAFGARLFTQPTRTAK